MKQILVVAYDQVSRARLKEALQGAYQVVEVSADSNVVAFAASRLPELILLDLDNHDTDGIDLCARLKENDATRNIPLILLSSINHKDDTLNGLLAGADDYLAKPIFGSELVTKIDAHLRHRDYYAHLGQKDLLMLLELTEIISVTRNPAKILATIVDKMGEVLDISRCSILNLNEEGDLIVKASNDLKKNQEIKLDLRKYPEIEAALSTRKPVVIDDLNVHPLMAPVRNVIKNLDYNSIYVVPIIKKQSVIGTFFLRTASPLQGGSERILKLCQVVANISGNALENALLFEALHSTKKLLEDMAVRDGLTKLYNHQFFYARLQDEFSRAQRYQQPLSCIFIDLDDFKRVNDRYGHIVGDVVLRKVGKLIAQTLRKCDIAARFGGEEFTLLLPNTPAKGVAELAERLCQMIAGLSIKQLQGDRITASIGAATFFAGNMQAPEELLEQADHGMYRAKAAGKNRINQAAVAC
jgi:two-component system, cell cycle response regulator